MKKLLLALALLAPVQTMAAEKCTFLSYDSRALFFAEVYRHSTRHSSITVGIRDHEPWNKVVELNIIRFRGSRSSFSYEVVLRNQKEKMEIALNWTAHMSDDGVYICPKEDTK